MQSQQQDNGAPRAEQSPDGFRIERVTRAPDGGTIKRCRAGWLGGYLVFVIHTDPRGHITLAACLRVIHCGGRHE